MTTLKQFEKLCLACDAAYLADWANGRQITDRRSYRIKKGEFREFAMWCEDGAQPGIHLRVEEAMLKAKDPRFKPSKVTKGKHNWLHLVAELDEAALKPLIAASYELAQRRGAGATPAAALYRPLQKAVDAAGIRPEGLHAGGPPAKIIAREGPAAFRLAMWSLEQVAPRVEASDRAVFTAHHERLRTALELYERVVRELPDREVRMGRGYQQISKQAEGLYSAEPKAPSSPALEALCGASGVFRCLPGGYPTNASLVECLENTVRVLAAAGRPQLVADYLVALDARILNEELLAALASRNQLEQVPSVQRVLWRGADEKGFPALWVAQVDGDRYAFFGKLGRKWTLVQGPRDEVLAAVPDAHFKDAAKRAGGSAQ